MTPHANSNSTNACARFFVPRQLLVLITIATTLFMSLCARALYAQPPEILNWNLGDATLKLDSNGYVQLLDANAQPIAPPTLAFALRYDSGEVAYVKSAQLAHIYEDEESIRAVFPDDSFVVFKLKRLPNAVLIQTDEVSVRKDVEELELFRVNVPNDPIATWINTTVPNDPKALRIGVMTASINVLPLVQKQQSARVDKPGCQHAFTPLTVPSEQPEASEIPNKPVACFAASSKLSDNSGYVMRGADFPKTIDLTGCVALRARVYGDGKHEALKIQLSGNGLYRDDYINIDFTGWKVCELNSPALNSLKYDSVKRLYYYYNSMPAQTDVRCLIDYVDAVFKDENGNLYTKRLEDFSDFDSPLWEQESQTLLAKSFARHDLTPAACALVVAPPQELPDAVKQVQIAADLPAPTLDGKWRGEAPRLHQSYLFLTSFSEKECDQALEFAKRGGFRQVLLLGGSWHKSTGHYQVNPKNFPDGIQSLRNVIEKFNRNGIDVGLHFLGASVDANDPYITPIPDKRFVTGYQTTLAQGLSDSKETVDVMTRDDGSNFPVGENPYMGSGQIVRIDDELLCYQDVAKEGLLKCQRGYYGTTVAEHKPGALVQHFTRAYGYHMPDLRTDFIDEIAENFAQLANQLPINMLYFDGSERLQNKDEWKDHWYYNARLHKAFYDKLDNKNLLIQASSCSPYSWNLIARNASADGHDDLNAYLEERSGGFTSGANSFSYLDVGWYYAYDANATPDMYEYCLGATLGYNASFSFQTSVAAANNHPFIGELLDMIRRYEDLRLSGRLTPEICENFRIDPSLAGVKSVEERVALLPKRRQFHLEELQNGDLQFRRVIYPRWHNIGSATSDLSGMVANDAVCDANGRYSWRLDVPQVASLGIQAHFCPKDADDTTKARTLKQLAITIQSLDTPDAEPITFTLDAALALGQYLMLQPNGQGKRYGKPLAEAQACQFDLPVLSLTPGAYEISAQFLDPDDETIPLPVRMCTPLYTEDIIPIP
ncbi:MAG: hypothetical protein Q4G03_00550 [Planctomycetia bacterium]|nr:hypothetical protein [Planctomycetia bacterium]